MIKKLLELEPKYIATIITSVGGIVLAYIIFSAYQSLVEVKTVEIATSVQKLADNVAGLKSASEAQIEASKATTDAVRDLRLFIQQSRIQAKLNRL